MYRCLYRKLNSIMPGRVKLLTGLLLSLSLSGVAETRQEMESWTYHREWDKWTDLGYSLARSPLPRRGVYDTLRLEIICRDNTLQFALDSYDLITSKGSTFDFEYQIDNNRAVGLTMRTYPDTKRRGYTEDRVKSIIDDLLSGQWVLIRAHTIIKRVLSSKISLQGAAGPIRKVLADCDESLPARSGESEVYGMEDLRRDLQALSPEQRRQVWDAIKQMIDDLRR